MPDELAVQEPTGAELEAFHAAEAEAIAEAQSELAGETLTIPMLSVVQGMTKDKPEESRDGDFFNTLTRATYEKPLEFVISSFHKGRFYVDEADDRRSYVTGDAVAPAYWPNEFAGIPFEDIPQAEEQYKLWANEEGNDWGSGPPIATTYNFTGYVVGDDIPCRLSLKRADTGTARTIITLMKAARAPWDKTISLYTERVDNPKGTFYGIKAKIGRPTEIAERVAAVELQNQLKIRTVVEHGTDDAPEGEAQPVAPAEDDGGLEV